MLVDNRELLLPYYTLLKQKSNLFRNRQISLSDILAFAGVLTAIIYLTLEITWCNLHTEKAKT
jgi:hypothetical protein